MKIRQFQILSLVLASQFLGCASTRSWFGMNDHERVRPIANPFSNYESTKDPAQTMILRTKKGDRSVELEIPGDPQHLSDFVLPVSPAFKNQDKNSNSNSADLSSPDGMVTSPDLDESYKGKAPSFSDREITRTFSQGSVEDEGQRREIEQALNLTPSDDNPMNDSTPSYLASVDHIKQLYRAQRFEAGLLAVDDLIRVYPTDSKLHEMRGTLLDRLGRRELALRSWNQALRFNPSNASLKRFIERKQLRSVAGGP